MKKLVLASTALTLVAGAALAQELPPAQSGSAWYTDAEAALHQRLAQKPITKRAKNVILMIGDGMGLATNYAIRLYAGQQEGQMGEEHVLPYEAYPYTAIVKTYNVNAQTPDSAPTAGAMNTGVKQIFNTINIDPEKAVVQDCTTEQGAALKTFAESETEAGKAVGFVTTARVTHATPAAVYAKTAYRDWESDVEGADKCPNSKDIAVQLLDAMNAGIVDFAAGGGRAYFAPKGTNTEEGKSGNRKDNRNLMNEARDKGIQYAWNTETFGKLKLDGKTPVLALLEDSHMKYEADRADTDEPSLEAMTKAAIDYLKTNDGGYYLEVEGGRIDHGNHDGNAYRTLTDGVAFAKAVAAADAMTDDEDTLIIVTADHSHALALNGYCGRGNPILGLCYGVSKGKGVHTDKAEVAADGKPYTVIGYLNGPGADLKGKKGENFTAPDGRPTLTEEQVTDQDYLQEALIPTSSETHSGEDVLVWAKGPYAHLFSGVIEQNYIYHVMNYAVNATEAAAAEPATATPAGTESAEITNRTTSNQ